MISGRNILSIFILLTLFHQAQAENIIASAHKGASLWIDRQAEKLDEYLSGKSESQKENQTHAKITFDSALAEGGNERSAVDFSLSLRLPNLEEKYQLLFSNYNEDEENQNISDRRRGGTSRRNYGASVGFFQQIGNIKTTFQPRLEISDPLQTYYILRLENSVQQNVNTYRMRVDFFADSTKGTGVFWSKSYARELTEIYSLSFIFEEEYEDGDNLFTTSQAIVLDQKKSDKSSFSYDLIFDSKSRPSYHLDNFSFGASYTTTPYRNVLSYTIGVTQNFSKSERFKGKSVSYFSLNYIL